MKIFKLVTILALVVSAVVLTRCYKEGDFGVDVTNPAWIKSFGGSDYDQYSSVTTVLDGIVAVGRSGPNSFGIGDWVGITSKGSTDAIIVKYDNNANVMWSNSWFDSSFSAEFFITSHVAENHR